MLRTAVFVLLAAYVVFFVWAQGWLAPVLPPPGAAEREPERLARQIHPESIIVLSPKAYAETASAPQDGLPGAAGASSTGAGAAPR
jgi:hypothetical protein